MSEQPDSIKKIQEAEMLRMLGFWQINYTFRYSSSCMHHILSSKEEAYDVHELITGAMYRFNNFKNQQDRTVTFDTEDGTPVTVSVEEIASVWVQKPMIVEKEEHD